MRNGGHHSPDAQSRGAPNRKARSFMIPIGTVPSGTNKGSRHANANQMALAPAADLRLGANQVISVGSSNSEGRAGSDTQGHAALNGADHADCDTQILGVGPNHFDGQRGYANRADLAVDGADHSEADTHRAPVGPELTLQIEELWRRRQAWVGAQTKLTLQLSAICRAECAGDKEEAKKLLAKLEKGKAENPKLEITALPLLKARAVLEDERVKLEEQIEQMTNRHPVAEWWRANVFKTGISLGAIIGECGDIARKFDSPAKLWKRMGLAVIENERQRCCKDPDLALIHGYSPRRRAVAWVIGDSLFRQYKKHPYGQVYLYRRKHTMESHPDWYREPTEQEKAKGAGIMGMISDHGHKDAVRYMVKRILRDLWREWRKLESMNYY